jgi:hypothetical protein
MELKLTLFGVDIFGRGAATNTANVGLTLTNAPRRQNEPRRVLALQSRRREA